MFTADGYEMVDKMVELISIAFEPFVYKQKVQKQLINLFSKTIVTTMFLKPAPICEKNTPYGHLASSKPQKLKDVNVKTACQNPYQGHQEKPKRPIELGSELFKKRRRSKRVKVFQRVLLFVI